MEIIKFDTLGLDPKILRAITEMGFEEPSPIQAKAIPEVMAGHDVIGTDRYRKNSSFWYSASSEDRPEEPETAGNHSVSDKRTGNPGSR